MVQSPGISVSSASPLSSSAAWAGGFETGIRDTEFFEPVRVLDSEHAGKIDDLIIAEIRASGLLVADFTGHRPSVYYEAGFAWGLGIPVILCCRKEQIDDVHFDIRQYNHVVWTDPGDLREKLKNRILAVVPAATKGEDGSQERVTNRAGADPGHILAINSRFSGRTMPS